MFNKNWRQLSGLWWVIKVKIEGTRARPMVTDLRRIDLLTLDRDEGQRLDPSNFLSNMVFSLLLILLLSLSFTFDLLLLFFTLMLYVTFHVLCVLNFIITAFLLR